MVFNLTSFIIGTIFGLLLIPFWRGTNKMCEIKTK